MTELGVSYDYITYWPNPFGFGGETRDPALLKWARRFPTLSNSTAHLLPFRIVLALIHEFLQSLWGIWAMARYDAFIFGFGETLLRGNADLPILKALGKTVVVNMAHGSEARPPYIDGSALRSDEDSHDQARRLALQAKKTAHRVSRIERHATYVIGAPYSNSQFSRRPFINHFAIGIPSSGQLLPPCDAIAHPEGVPTVILHSPSNPSIKGTAAIELAIKRLSDRGSSIEYRVIAGRPNTEVLDAIRACDLVVDQIYSDTPLAGFATEAAWLGRCAVVGGYALDELRSHIPLEMMPPSFTCRPDEVEQAIAYLLDNPKEREALAHRAQAFVSTNWNAAVVARRYLSILDNEIPSEWWIDPATVNYWYGMGLAQDEARATIREVVQTSGLDALQVSADPCRLDQLISFSLTEPDSDSATG
jgi:hypothetical protein